MKYKKFIHNFLKEATEEQLEVIYNFLLQFLL